MIEIPNPVMQRVNAFDERHGGLDSAVRSKSGRQWLFPDGARRDVDPVGILEEPPRLNSCEFRGNAEAHSWAVLQRRVAYYETKDERRQARFESERRALYGTNYTDEEFKELERLKALSDEAFEEHEAIMREVLRHPVHQRQIRSAELEAEKHQVIEDKKRKLDTLR